MPKVIYDPSKGLFQKSGAGFSGKTSTQTIASSGTISTEGLVAIADISGNVTGVKLQAGTEIGQICILVNVAGGSHSIDFATAASSLFAGATGTDRTLPKHGAVTLVWSGTLWHPTSQTLS